MVCIADDTLSPVVKDAAVPRLLPPFAANLEGAPRSVQNNIEPKSTQTTLPPTSTISAADEPLYEFSDEPDDMNRCDMAKHPGTPSSAAKQTAYYWNKEKFACLAFKYSGTGGTQNNFATKSDCNTACMPSKSLLITAYMPIFVELINATFSFFFQWMGQRVTGASSRVLAKGIQQAVKHSNVVKAINVFKAHSSPSAARPISKVGGRC